MSIEELADLPSAVFVGVIILLVIREIVKLMDWAIKAAKGKPTGNNKAAKLLQDLWEWHNCKDDDGVFVWYVRRSFERAVSQLAEGALKSAQAQSRTVTVLEHLEQRISRLEDRLSDRGG